MRLYRRRPAVPRKLNLLDAQDRGRMADSYAGGSIFIYQLIMGLALTNAAVIFFTSGTTALRPITSYNPVETVLFIDLIAFAIIRVFEYTAGMAFNIRNLYPKRGGALFFIIDTFLGVIEALLFYVLSIALRDLPGAFLNYFYLVTSVYVVDIVSILSGLVDMRNIDRRTLVALVFNVLAIGIGAVFVISKQDYALPALVAVFTIRVLVDYATAYTRAITGAASPG